MKTIFLSSLMLFLCVSLSAQKITYGMSIGVQRSGFELEKDFSLSNEVSALSSKAKAGFNLGVHSLIKIADRVKLSPQLLIDFSNIELETQFTNDMTTVRSLELVQIRTPVDLHLELLRGATSIYLLSGVEYVIGVEAEEEPRNQLLDTKRSFWSGRIGIGGRKDFERFSVSPEITFAKSFNSIEGEENLVLNEVITGMNNAVLGLSVKFQGLLANE